MTVTHLGYDPEKGTWEFEVYHFSRYGLSDEDEEPDVKDAITTTDLSAIPSAQPQHSGILDHFILYTILHYPVRMSKPRVC